MYIIRTMSYATKYTNPDRQRIFNILLGMKDRCYNPRYTTKRYIEMHLTICDEWLHDREAFYRWALSHGYRSDLQIDRIDNSKGYSPENCRWVTAQENCNNKDNNIRITIKDETHTLAEWCRIRGLPYKQTYTRIRRGWNPVIAINTPIKVKPSAPKRKTLI